ncbi:Histone deacetylase HDT1 [Vitis vinifera]|uniref:Histone deacetylase HDT1 n=1 Tax=Vitis vinifera TaxID=29760 RepID=A0A438F3A2_VITVI|nr:Histone deacetylase HDT1 [Vitis vinifera]
MWTILLIPTGVEVKAGESFKVKSEDDKILHLSQAALGESKKEKGNESVPLFLKIDQQKLVLGTLLPANIPQLSFDLVFDKEFELSHNWKNGSVFFMGYKSVLPDEYPYHFSFFDFVLCSNSFFYIIAHICFSLFLEFDDSDSEEDLPVNAIENGKPEPKVEQAKAVPTNANAGKAKVKVEEPPKDAKDEEDDDDDSDEDMVDEDSDEDSDEDIMSDAEDGSDEGSESEDEETPKKKVEPGKKRPTESATKTPVPAKKAKLVSPQKTDGKKGGAHTATPHPNKKAGKTPASGDKGKGQSPKSGGQVSCKSCSKTFNSENALQSHSKAKHGVS